MPSMDVAFCLAPILHRHCYFPEMMLLKWPVPSASSLPVGAAGGPHNESCVSFAMRRLSFQNQTGSMLLPRYLGSQSFFPFSTFLFSQVYNRVAAWPDIGIRLATTRCITLHALLLYVSKCLFATCLLLGICLPNTLIPLTYRRHL